MKKLKKNELQLNKEDNAEVRKLFKDVSLKLRRKRRSQAGEALSLLQMIIQDQSSGQF